jgi:hypothetical protein
VYEISYPGAGLPDDIFSNQKIQLRVYFGEPWNVLIIKIWQPCPGAFPTILSYNAVNFTTPRVRLKNSTLKNALVY